MSRTLCRPCLLEKAKTMQRRIVDDLDALLGIFPSEMAIDWGKVVFKGLFIKGIYGREMFETWYKMATMIQGGLDISPVITHRFPIEEFKKGFEVMGSGRCGKVILDWGVK